MISFKFSMALVWRTSWKEENPEAWILYQGYCRILGDDYNPFHMEWGKWMDPQLYFKFAREIFILFCKVSIGSQIYSYVYIRS